MGVLDAASRETVLEMLGRFGLPTRTEFPPDTLYETLLLDKKFASGRLHLIVPHTIGWCVTVAVTPDELRQWLEAGYESE